MPRQSPPEPPDEPRARLAAVIGEITATQARLDALADARNRAREQGNAAASALYDSRAALRQAGRDERSRLAYAFVNAEGELADPVADARAAVSAAEAETARLDKIEAALIAEIGDVQAELNQLRTARDVAMSAVVCASPQYEALILQHKTAWQTLRTIKTALAVVERGLRGAIPNDLIAMASRSEPVEERVGFPLDRRFVAAWAAALRDLETDADAALPAPVDPEFIAVWTSAFADDPNVTVLTDLANAGEPASA
jgi:chromosome segregation ATPase